MALMRIGFIGPGGTGKTTIAKPLAEALGLPLMVSPSREAFEFFKVKTEDDQAKLMPAERKALQLRIFRNINEQVENNERGVFERTPLDNFFYFLSHAGDFADRAEIEAMEIRVKENMMKFTRLFFFSIYPWPDINDGMRTQSFAQRLIMQRFLCNTLHDVYGKFFYILADVPPEERVRRLVQHISKIQ